MGRTSLRLLSRLSPALLATALLLPLAAPAAHAQAFSWLLPAGAETWTAGTTHAIEWSGGPAGNVNVNIISLSPFAVADVVATGVPNTGSASWTIPIGLAPGSYQAYVQDAGNTTWSYSQTFTVQAGPDCGEGCTVVAAGMPASSPPGAICGTTMVEADSLARAYIMSGLICPTGSVLDLNSVMIDVTVLPVAVCWAGYGGAYMVDVSAVACCCPYATSGRSRTWGGVKSIYR